MYIQILQNLLQNVMTLVYIMSTNWHIDLPLSSISSVLYLFLHFLFGAVFGFV